MNHISALGVGGLLVLVWFAGPAFADAPFINPVKQIVPLDDDAALIVAGGDMWQAAETIDNRWQWAHQATNALQIDTSLADRDVPKYSQWLTGVVNTAFGVLMHCQALSRSGSGQVGFMISCTARSDQLHRDFWCIGSLGEGVTNEQIDDCVIHNSAEDASWAPWFRLFTEAAILEAEGRFGEAQDAYLELREPLSGGVHAYERVLLTSRAEWATAASLVWDYMTTRSARLQLMTGQLEPGDLPAFTEVPYCEATEPNVCPGSYLALHGMLNYVRGQSDTAERQLSDALRRPQRWIGVDPYEHPLFWVAMIAHQRSDDAGVAHALRHRNELSIDRPPDVDFVLDLYAGNMSAAMMATDDMSSIQACQTAGCRFFLAQYIRGIGLSQEAGRLMAQSAEDCQGSQSFMCGIVRASGAGAIDAATP